MEKEITIIFCLCDDFVKAMIIQDNPQTDMTTAEVMTTALVAARFFGGNIEISRCFLKEHNYISTMLSKSRLNRRLHAIPFDLWHNFFRLLGEINKQTNLSQEYIIDSVPVPVCDNIRISRCRLYQGESYVVISPASGVTFMAYGFIF